MNTPSPTPPWWWFKIASFWHSHGTKLIGGFVTTIGLVAAGNPAIVAWLNSLVGTSRAAGLVVAATGAMTVYRGFQNTKSNS